MRKWFVLSFLLALASIVEAAPNVTNATQKGSLLVFPDVSIVPGIDTLIRIENDGSSDVDVICYWMDGNKNRVDFIIPVTKNQPVWFDARTGNGSVHVNRFPQTPANGFDNPFLPGGAGPYLIGMLACWAVDGGAQNQVKWNHLSGTATVYDGILGAYEYNAYAFFVPTGIDLAPIGTAGTLNLNGVEYDSCPLYQIGQFSPLLTLQQTPPPFFFTNINRLAVVGCSLNLNQDWAPVWTKLQFDVWNADEVKFTGAFECADSWHQTSFLDGALTTISGTDARLQVSLGGIDSAAQNFLGITVGTAAARYRVQGVKSTQCEDPFRKPPIVTQAVGLIAVQSSSILLGPNTVPTKTAAIGTTLAAAGKFTGKVVWDPEGGVPEGGIR